MRASIDTGFARYVSCKSIPRPNGGSALRTSMMEILVCPMCKGELTLTVDKQEGDEVIDGSLRCARCNEIYPIAGRIPNLLPPELRKA